MSSGSERTSSFEAFFESWIAQQEHFLQQLNLATQLSEPELRDLITRVRQHYQTYENEKSRLLREDTLSVLSPTWLTPFEKIFLWVAGWKPSLAFRLVNKSAGELSHEQLLRMERVKAEVKAEEREMSEEMAKLHETMGSPPVLELARRTVRGRGDGEREQGDSVVEGLRVALEVLLGEADSLRAKTVSNVFEILSPLQTARFLAAVAELQLRIRRLGLQREAARSSGVRG